MRRFSAGLARQAGSRTLLLMTMMEPIRYAMVAGGRGAFIGAIHRTAAAIAGNWSRVAGALSSMPEKALASGEKIGLDPARNYGSWPDMLEREEALPANERIEAVSIVTPNHAHAAAAIAAMEGGETSSSTSRSDPQWILQNLPHTTRQIAARWDAWWAGRDPIREWSAAMNRVKLSANAQGPVSLLHDQPWR
jgi:hypothetical protein